jgi:hypothetical protein
MHLYPSRNLGKKFRDGARFQGYVRAPSPFSAEKLLQEVEKNETGAFWWGEIYRSEGPALIFQLAIVLIKATFVAIKRTTRGVFHDPCQTG